MGVGLLISLMIRSSFLTVLGYCSAAVRGISSVLQYRGIVKDAQKIGNELADLYREILAK